MPQEPSPLHDNRRVVLLLPILIALLAVASRMTEGIGRAVLTVVLLAGVIGLVVLMARNSRAGRS